MIENVWIFDFEVTAFDWLVVFKSYDTKEYVVIHNEPLPVRQFIAEHNPLLGGFNTKHYDSFILAAVINGFSPPEVKQVNDWIIGGEEGWNCPTLRGIRRNFRFFDLMDDCQVGTSLKSIEAHLGMNITESTVSFDIDRAWTKAELDEMVYYCKADVDATERLFELRQNYLNSKIQVGAMAGLTADRSIYLTNAGLTAEFLGAKKQEYNDERDYVYPDNLKKEYIPQAVFDFFDRMHDKTLSDDDVYKSKLNIKIGETEVTIGYGGIHAGIPNYKFKK